MVFETLTVSEDDGIGRLTLNQPDKLNPLGTQSLEEIVRATEWFDQQNTAVVVINGAGRAFSSGLTLENSQMKTPKGETDLLLENKWRMRLKICVL
mgnify:CR=1 FL=1